MTQRIPVFRKDQKLLRPYSSYEGIINTLKNAGLVSESAHLLTWIGPKLEAKS